LAAFTDASEKSVGTITTVFITDFFLSHALMNAGRKLRMGNKDGLVDALYHAVSMAALVHGSNQLFSIRTHYYHGIFLLQ